VYAGDAQIEGDTRVRRLKIFDLDNGAGQPVGYGHVHGPGQGDGNVACVDLDRNAGARRRIDLRDAQFAIVEKQRREPEFRTMMQDARIEYGGYPGHDEADEACQV